MILGLALGYVPSIEIVIRNILDSSISNERFVPLNDVQRFICDLSTS